MTNGWGSGDRISQSWIPSVLNVIKLFSIGDLDVEISPKYLEDSKGAVKEFYMKLYLYIYSFSEPALALLHFRVTGKFIFKPLIILGEIPTSRFPTEKSFITLGTDRLFVPFTRPVLSCID